MKKILFNSLIIAILLLTGKCKPTYVLKDDVKNMASEMSPDDAAAKLNTIIVQGKSSARTGLDEIATGGSTSVNKDSIIFSTIDRIEKSSGSFADGYNSDPAYTNSRWVVITLKFDRVNTIKVNELKDGNVRFNLKDNNEFFLNSSQYQFETMGTNRDMVIALCSVLMPRAKIDYSGR